jgi:hypothetical protein
VGFRFLPPVAPQPTGGNLSIFAVTLRATAERLKSTSLSAQEVSTE